MDLLITVLLAGVSMIALNVILVLALAGSEQMHVPASGENPFPRFDGVGMPDESHEHRAFPFQPAGSHFETADMDDSYSFPLFREGRGLDLLDPAGPCSSRSMDLLDPACRMEMGLDPDPGTDMASLSSNTAHTSIGPEHGGLFDAGTGMDHDLGGLGDSLMDSSSHDPW